MEDQLIELFKETINNQYFIPVVIIAIFFIFVKSIIEYKKYLKTCEIFSQKPKLSGYIKNSIMNIFGIILITVIGFSGYTGLTNSTLFEEKYINEVNKKEKIKDTVVNIKKDSKYQLILNTNTKLKKDLIRLESNNKYLKKLIDKPKEKQLKKKEIEPFVKLLNVSKDKQIERLKKENKNLQKIINVNKNKIYTHNLNELTIEKNKTIRLERDIKILIKKYDKCTESLEKS